jgi:hypothetical protein
MTTAEEQMEGALALRDEGIDGFRHYLNGEPVRAGELLELRLDDGAWVRGRYEWSFSNDDLPRLHLRNDNRSLPLRPGSLVRRPAEYR